MGLASGSELVGFEPPAGSGYVPSFQDDKQVSG